MKDLVVRTYREFSRDGGSRIAAALAYYALFAIAPALIVAVALAGVVLGQATASAVARESLAELLGPELSAALIDLAASRSVASYYETVWIALVVFLATSALALIQVQTAFNRMWGLDVREGESAWRVVRARLAQAAIALLPAVLLVVATFANSVTAAIATRPVLGRFADLIETFGSPLMILGSSAVAFLAVFKYLPDAYVPWRPALVSSVLTAVAWFIGTSIFGLYVGRASTASVYGAAGSAFVMLIWLNYSARIALIGCKVSKVLAERRGSAARPRPYATRVTYVPVEDAEGSPTA